MSSDLWDLTMMILERCLVRDDDSPQQRTPEDSSRLGGRSYVVGEANSGEKNVFHLGVGDRQEGVMHITEYTGDGVQLASCQSAPSAHHNSQCTTQFSAFVAPYCLCAHALSGLKDALTLPCLVISDFLHLTSVTVPFLVSLKERFSPTHPRAFEDETDPRVPAVPQSTCICDMCNRDSDVSASRVYPTVLIVFRMINIAAVFAILVGED
ncbi:hypothetical protein J6590_020852 [Homalodisca vitripennis]|nr:hypothetical protein J6590_020852 [Homalodisca vitripennis]